MTAPAPAGTAALLAAGLARHRAGALREAADIYAEVLRAEPRNAGALHLMGVLAQQTGDAARAAGLLAAAAQEAPGEADVWFNLALALEGQGRAEAAERALRHALAAQPAHAGALARLAGRLSATGRQDEAMEAYLRLAVAQPGELGALILASDIARSVLRFERLPDIVSRLARRLDPPEAIDDWRPLSSLLYRDLFMPLPDGLWMRLARRIDALLGDQVRRQGGPLPAAPRPAAAGRRLRIGYVSGNFGDHPIGHVTLSLFAAHDRGRFEVHGFSRRDRTAEPSGYGARHALGFDHLHQVGGLDPKGVAERIHALGIDILVEIDGHMDKSGLETLAFRPAPVQVFWLGHAGGLGCGGADYLIADAVVVPPGEEPRHRERVVRLPEAYHCADRHPIDAGAGTRADWGLPEDGVVYCAFNNVEKITGEVFRSWMRILAAVEGSVLWLTTSASATARMAHLRRHSAACGVDPRRLVCAERVAGKGLHLARHRLADLFLDTLVINASTTALDALWAGLPVLTVAGERFSGRIAETMLRAVGLPDLVCPTLAAFEERAVALGHDAAARAALKARLAANRTTHPLFDVHRFARHLEAAFARMWARHEAGEAPAAFDVPPLP